MLLAAAQAAVALCVCVMARETNGWCPVHNVGWVGGLALTSAWLHEAVDAHGHDVDVATFTCPSCRRAIATDGFCDEHKIGFVHAKAYFSRLTYLLGKGTIRRPATIDCRVCRKNSESRGWCDRCKLGMAGPVTLRDRSEYDQVVHALEILERANGLALRCEHCAVAMITDTRCPFCRILYKDGKAVGG